MSSSRITYIYGLECPLEGGIKYVGRSVDPHKRFLAHTAPGSDKALSNTNKINRSWIKRLAAQGMKPHLVILESVTANNGDDRERQWIASLASQGHELSNREIVGSNHRA